MTVERADGLHSDLPADVDLVLLSLDGNSPLEALYETNE
jgi:hypothetical protein